MRQLALGVVVLAACGAPAKPTTTGTGKGPPPPPPTTAPPVAVKVTPELACTKVDDYVKQQCGAFGRTLNPTHDQCLASFQPRGNDPREERYRQRVMHCMVDDTSCDAVTNCLGDLSKPDLKNLRACEDTGAEGDAVGVSAADYAKRNGSSARTFPAVVSSPQHPVERCGIDDANEWLVSLSCPDGSKPLANHADAEGVRVGNIGPNGRCGSIVDHYRVDCGGKDGATDVYIDAYVCPKR